MNKFFYSVLAAATMLFATTSCSEDDPMTPEIGHDGKTQKVTFKVEMPGETASRAIADGVEVAQANMANKLAWALYESSKVDQAPVLTGNASKDPSSKEFNVSIDMVKGLEYKVLFLAYCDGGTIFDVTPGDDLKSLNYNPSLVSNQEAYDAFVACHTHTVNNDAVTEVTLTRPFAQINAATTDADLERAGRLQATVTHSSLTIANVPTQYNVLTGEASAYQDVTYGFGAILKDYAAQTNEILTVDNANYNYLNMVYVLADASSSTHSATFTFYRNSDEADAIRTIDIVNLPIQRNYRTNVIGDLITQTEAFKIVIDEEFDGNHNLNGSEQAATTTNVATMDELQDAINAANGPTIIKFEQDIDANSSRAAASITIVQKVGTDIVIDGCGFKFDGTFYLEGGMQGNSPETLTFRNINFNHAEGSLDFISADDAKTVGKRYAHNVRVEDCTFTGNDNGDVVGMRYRQCYNMSVINSTATGLHSLMQATGCDGITIDGVTINESLSGITFNTSINLTVNNSNITATENYGYGIRVGNSDNANSDLTVTDCEISADAPILLRGLTEPENYTLTLKGTNTLNTDKAYQIIICSNDYKENVVLEEPTGKYSISGAEGLNMFPVRVLHEESGLISNGKNTYYLYNAEDLQKAVTYFNGFTHTNEAVTATLELEADIDLKNEEWTPWEVMWITLNGNNHTISNVKVSEGWKSGFFAYIGGVKVNDLTLENVNVTGAQAGILAAAVEGVTTNNIRIKGTNSVTYKEYSSADYTETWGGIGAVTGLLSASTINAEIVEGAKVGLYFNDIATQATFMGYLSGYLEANKGKIVQNGTLQYGTVAYGISNNGTTATFTAVDESDNTKTVRSIVEGNQNIKRAVVSEGIEIVGNRTFRRCYGLESVTLPSTLTTIEDGAFQSCNKLSSINIPSSVTTIGEGAFAECTSLTSINIPTGVTRIEKDALRNTGLTSIEFPAGVIYFGTFALRDCESLTEVTINAPSFTIENNTFTNMAAPVPTMTIYVVNAEMKAYLEEVLTSYDKTYITVVVK